MTVPHVRGTKLNYHGEFRLKTKGGQEFLMRKGTFVILDFVSSDSLLFIWTYVLLDLKPQVVRVDITTSTWLAFKQGKNFVPFGNT